MSASLQENTYGKRRKYCSVQERKNEVSASFCDVQQNVLENQSQPLCIVSCRTCRKARAQRMQCVEASMTQQGQRHTLGENFPFPTHFRDRPWVRISFCDTL